MRPFFKRDSCAVRVENLFRNFDGKEVLNNISFEMGFGESVALIGRNGSGKTTLFRILATLSQPSSGTAWLGGYSVAKDSMKIRSLIGWVPASDHGFVPRFKGIENLLFFGSLHGLSKKEILSALAPWKGVLSLDLALQTPFYLSSAGMKQSLQIARALLSNPPILIMDEPTRSLDTESIKQLRTFLIDGVNDRTLLFSTHSESGAAVLAKRSLHLQEGKLV
jgi:ABC-type multidrug transport system ATPase subunit